MIRQTVTCDICGVHKLDTNHWFMAVEHNGGLRISHWGGSNPRPHTKHLCGQKCVHRLVDDFLAGHPVSTVVSGAADLAVDLAPDESSAKLITDIGPRPVRSA